MPKDPDNQVTKSHKHYSAKNQEESRQYLVDWIVDNIQPISIVANLKFRQLINQLNPTFVMPCPENSYVRYPHTSQHILETLEEVLKEWKIRELQSERLEDIQKKFPDLNNDLRKENINPEKTSEYLLHVISDSPI
ncbi:unnamed protein product [Rhizophagus irregularis]|nr:unnamed protein product [Rhizophagus irregularis]